MARMTRTPEEEVVRNDGSRASIFRTYRTEIIYVRLAPAERLRFDDAKRAGGYRSRTDLILDLCREWRAVAGSTELSVPVHGRRSVAVLIRVTDAESKYLAAIRQEAGHRLLSDFISALVDWGHRHGFSAKS